MARRSVSVNDSAGLFFVMRDGEKIDRRRREIRAIRIEG